MNNKAFTQRPLFWILFLLISIGCIAFSFKYFSVAQPMIHLDLQMDRSAALEKARILAEKYNWKPEKFRQAALFAKDETTQIERQLDCRGIRRASVTDRKLRNKDPRQHVGSQETKRSA